MSLPVLVAAAALTYGCNFLIDVGGYRLSDVPLDGGDEDAPTIVPPDAGVDAEPPPGASALKWARWKMPNSTGDLVTPPSYSPDESAKTVVDDVTRLTWSLVTASASTYEDARALCAKQGTFRLPTRIELVSLLDFSNSNPKGTKVSASTKLDLLPTFYWTQSYLPPPGDGTYTFWMVNFSSGVVEPRGPANSGVLCIRDAS